MHSNRVHCAGAYKDKLIDHKIFEMEIKKRVFFKADFASKNTDNKSIT